MSIKADDIIIIKKRAEELKNEFEKELEKMITEVVENKPNTSKEDNLEALSEEVKLTQYQKKHDELKDDIKMLKKIKKQQKKISKLEEEKKDVLTKMEYENRKHRKNSNNGHKKH